MNDWPAIFLWRATFKEAKLSLVNNPRNIFRYGNDQRSQKYLPAIPVVKFFVIQRLCFVIQNGVKDLLKNVFIDFSCFGLTIYEGNDRARRSDNHEGRRKQKEIKKYKRMTTNWTAVFKTFSYIVFLPMKILTELEGFKQISYIRRWLRWLLAVFCGIALLHITN